MVTFQFIPFHDIERLSSAKRVNKLLNIVKDNKIVIMEGRLKKQEEADLIEITMEEISAKFKGIELSVVYPDRNKQTNMQKMKGAFANVLLGDRQGMTIIGPASIVKKIEKNPDKIELFTNDSKNSTRYRKRKRK
ncbi:DUF2073 domain-containing protein [Candidatus Woesearchaeota archaeon]|jgi:hypothetical protein|nr:DUF2073 domain-containing protein [Candidatus Woesearchaeota archaeon]MBT4150716.1 DUF2073 domain-containing protein [Candidatus Woesearchaeota archaeon]MBT4247532.1 DUF2073 domain-containing protein [Candidatus Woesearchaeota archaeon]MBT4434397.1 DUF2073 domain-containing protein [Candidatus Woesearchaeota archaeon]MBT7331934.1 DUF2073 domain-containing protein [Candidatus Woesearchaeota archaeon]